MMYWSLIFLLVASPDLTKGEKNTFSLEKKRSIFSRSRNSNEFDECTITPDTFAAEYSAIVEMMGIYDPQTGESCSVGRDPEGEVTTQEWRIVFGDYGVCETLFNFSQRILLNLNATSFCCLTNSSGCASNSDRNFDEAKAYGYGTLMVVLLSLLSLLGVFIIPLVKKNERCGHVYDYISLFLIAMGTSALFSDAMLHLIPQVFQQSEGEGGRAILWKVCGITGGMYLFYIIEMLLHRVTNHNNYDVIADNKNNPLKTSPLLNRRQSRKGLLMSLDHDRGSIEVSNISYSKCKALRHRIPFQCDCVCDIKPLAVLIILGDAFHNFTDGIALGAAISQDLALGVSTITALVFHEIPHELGDYAILLSTGLRWYVALLLNFLSSLTSLAGFYIAMSIGGVSRRLIHGCWQWQLEHFSTYH